MADNQILGFIFSAISVLAFGSNFVPVKKFETGDGVFYQWVMCMGIFASGFVVNVLRGFPPFQPVAMLGGFIWCVGNFMAVPVIQTIGLGLGVLIWGITSMSMGWLTGTFGFFGLTRNDETVHWLNYLGFGMTVVSAMIFSLVKSGKQEKKEEVDEFLINEYMKGSESENIYDSMAPMTKRIVGVVLSVLSGICYGSNFDPPQYMIDHNLGPPNGMDYVFSHFTGIILTSTFFMMAYSLAKINKPKVYPRIIVPGFLSGIVWSVGQICFFGANTNLPFVITFPIISAGPGIIASIWGIAVFKEISGKRNFLIFSIGCIIALIGITCITLSSLLAPKQ